jgi:hypothetical protein
MRRGDHPARSPSAIRRSRSRSLQERVTEPRSRREPTGGDCACGCLAQIRRLRERSSPTRRIESDSKNRMHDCSVRLQTCSACARAAGSAGPRRPRPRAMRRRTAPRLPPAGARDRRCCQADAVAVFVHGLFLRCQRPKGKPMRLGTSSLRRVRRGTPLPLLPFGA